MANSSVFDEIRKNVSPQKLCLRPFTRSLARYSPHSVCQIVNCTGNGEFQTLRWKFLNIIATVEAPHIFATQVGVANIT